MCKLAFELAQKRQMRVTFIKNKNITKSGLLWGEILSAVHAASFMDVILCYLDMEDFVMQLALQPEKFDVIITDNLCRDILFNRVELLAGPIGLLPSASFGSLKKNGQRHAIYGPVHGAAQDIAGQNKANPLGMILSYALCLRHSFKLLEDAHLLEVAVKKVLESGLRTADIMQPSMTLVSCEQMGSAVITELKLIEQGFCLE
jgi:3-isopropylmalate dehydrogenase